ncbi:MAG: hypothetical protein JO362_10730 [Streptomycetaceae bacterium]|nr:hypothetical protein [Streptomycetaceae bacterium]
MPYTPQDRPLELGELTAGEKARIAWLGVRMCKASIPGDNATVRKYQRDVDRILDRARKRADAA